MTVNSTNEFLYQISAGLLLLVIFVSTVNFGINSYEVVRFTCILMSIIIVVLFLYYRRSYYAIFAVSTFIFALNIPLLELLSIYALPPGNRMLLGDGIKKSIPLDVISLSYIVHTLVLFGLYFANIIDYFFISISNKKTLGKNSDIISYVFVIGWCVVLYNNFKLAYSANSLGYVEVMHKHSVDIGIGFIGKTFDAIYQTLGALYLYYSVNSREYVKRSVVFFVPFIIQMAAGARGETVAVLVSLIFIYHFFYHRIKLKAIFLVSVLGFVIITALGMLRYETTINDFVGLGLVNIITVGLVSGASSLGVLSYTIMNLDYFTNDAPFFFGYIDAIVSFAPNYTIEGIQDKNYLAQHITYLLNPNKLFHGSTIGTSMTAELYELFHGNLVMITTGAFLIFLGIGYLIKRMYSSSLMFFFVFQLLHFLWLAPRGSVMKVFSKELLIGVLALILVENIRINFRVKS